MKRANDPSSFTFEGLCCAVHSPMKDDLTLNSDVVEPTAQHLVKNHVNGVFVCGTTGESMLLSVAERKQVNGDKGLRMDSLRRSGSRLATSTASA